MSTVTPPPKAEARRPATDGWLWGIVVLAIALRIAAVCTFSGELNKDRDAYLGIARAVAAGDGFSTPGSTRPTAYRPPLYPLLLAPISGTDQLWLRAGLQVALGAGTVLLTWVAARRLTEPACSPSRHSAAWTHRIAAGIVAIDPMLLLYTPQMMTETLATFLAAAVLALGMSPPVSWSRSRQIAIGAGLGLACLCRPTFLPGAALWALWIAWTGLRPSRREAASSPLANAPAAERLRRLPWLALLALGLTIAPWPIRNQLRFGRPIVTTTHGGYTLLLSNNPVYYAEVVRAPWGTVWAADSLDRWQREQTELAAAAGARGEIAEDRWYSDQARAWIGTHPREFLEASLHRVRSFWKLAPSGEGAGQGNAVRNRIIAVYYGLQFGVALCGLVGVLRRRDGRFALPLLLILSLTALHAVYFSNARMRAPLVPALALLASGCGLFRRSESAAAPSDEARNT
ncbi:hypothetical protein VT03_08610 [Planctomyces sp. SH-PL14]|nr:hypothetical protein VT03_08610 [Planctomyces sp. SH-PL14]